MLLVGLLYCIVLTFAHSGSVINNKSSDIFFVRHGKVIRFLVYCQWWDWRNGFYNTFSETEWSPLIFGGVGANASLRKQVVSLEGINVFMNEYLYNVSKISKVSNWFFAVVVTGFTGFGIPQWSFFFGISILEFGNGFRPVPSLRLAYYLQAASYQVWMVKGTTGNIPSMMNGQCMFPAVPVWNFPESYRGWLCPTVKVKEHQRIDY